jgi:hypothetical protein
LLGCIYEGWLQFAEKGAAAQGRALQASKDTAFAGSGLLLLIVASFCRIALHVPL